MNRFTPKVVPMANIRNTIIMTSSKTLIQAMHLFSPTLPIGAFAFSQGLEAAIENRRVSDAESLQRWCEGVMRFSLSSLDCHYARMAYQSSCDQQFLQVNVELLASRETRELLLEDTLLGAALKKWAIDLKVEVPDANEYSLVCLYGWIAAKLEIPEDWAVAGLLWAWLDNQMIVAAKAIPLGQNSLQQVLAALKPLITECVELSKYSENLTPHSTVPFLTILSAQHETQYSRLFRS